MPHHKVAFISGPLEPSDGYFTMHYQTRLDEAINAGHHFVLGGATGIDTEALSYLAPRVNIDRITVYFHHNQAQQFRPRLRWFETRGGRVLVTGRNHLERDEACTRASHYDILRYRTEAECKALYGTKWRNRVSGTEKNEKRRAAGVGMIWAEGPEETEAIETDPRTEEVMRDREIDQKRRKLERKVRQARNLGDRLARGEPLDVNQVAKATKIEQWERELAEVCEGEGVAG